MKTQIGLGLLAVALLTAGAGTAGGAGYDETLAKRLGADARGMRRYVLVILKTGPRTDASADDRAKLFAGHMANLGRLADEGKVVVAGPLAENASRYEGIFVFDVPTVDEAVALLQTDPAVQGGLLAYEAFGWYSSAALREIPSLHRRIDGSAPH